MKANEVRTDDSMVVDREGTIWFFNTDVKKWDYVVMTAMKPDGGKSGWDLHEALPTHYEPYTALDLAARLLIGKVL